MDMDVEDFGALFEESLKGSGKNEGSVITGIVVASLTTRTLQGLLNGVQPNHPLTFAAASAAIVAVALLAAWLPARRAAKVSGAEAFAADS